MCGALKAADLDKQLDINGTSFATAAKEAGYGGQDHKARPVEKQCQWPRAAILLVSISVLQP